MEKLVAHYLMENPNSRLYNGKTITPDNPFYSTLFDDSVEIEAILLEHGFKIKFSAKCYSDYNGHKNTKTHYIEISSDIEFNASTLTGKKLSADDEGMYVKSIDYITRIIEDDTYEFGELIAPGAYAKVISVFDYAVILFHQGGNIICANEPKYIRVL